VISKPLLPGATIGIVGGGQLGRMLVLEARRMGYRTVVLEPDETSPAGQIADAQICAPLADIQAATELANRCDVVTLEWENADVEAISRLESLVPVRPGSRVLRIAQNRVLEKTEARALGLRTAEFRAIDGRDALVDAVREMGTPCLLKTSTGGYDGKGQRFIRAPEEVDAAYAEVGGDAAGPMILEGIVDFTCEVSVICARSADDTVASFPVSENIHRNGILDYTLVPARITPEVAADAVEIGETLARGLGVVGVLAVELFVDRDGRLFVNEIAPRPHNSGHYSWEACTVSQFEQQLRAVCGLPLAEPVQLRPAVMANLLGEHIGTGCGLTTIPDALRVPMLSLHLYGKRAARPRRKMGHLTVLADDLATAYERASAARETLMAGLDG
jgi:5-(carboxyamino)imidazole ribonucleotide synthase